MGTTVPSGMVAVVGAAVRKTDCWPNPATAAKRRNTLTTAATFNVALDSNLFIGIMVIASRRRFVLETNLNAFSPYPRPGCKN
jgi:hypothetical protein